ncbi:hypothetical protein ATANTOWER_030197 [Ataeniobius toweri]|uniref:Uncharacterized protein n=1 Tax=Ataeniobius toweri TaxID=208326 RepID=A0ABU7AUJ0_9TELE|nr:hypothetical protein [Ataeniobius toweri]
MTETGWHGGAVGSTVALQQEAPGLPDEGYFCMEFASSPCACVGSLRVFRLPPTVQGMTVRFIGLSKLSSSVNGCVHGCLSCVSLCCPVMDWTCQGCTPPLVHRPLEIGSSSPMTLYGRSRYRKWMDNRNNDCIVSV